jgi:hypothetical protein
LQRLQASPFVKSWKRSFVSSHACQRLFAEISVGARQ